MKKKTISSLGKKQQDKLKFERQLKLAKKSNSAGELAALALSHSSEVREEVARNKNTLKRILRDLSKDGYASIRELVVSNPNTPEDVLLKLATDKKWEVRMVLASVDTATKKVLIKLAKDKDPFIVNIVAENHKTPDEALEFIVKSKGNIEAKRTIANRKPVSKKLLMLMAGVSDTVVRLLLIKRLDTSDIKKLSEKNRQNLKNAIKDDEKAKKEWERKVQKIVGSAEIDFPKPSKGTWEKLRKSGISPGAAVISSIIS